MGFLRQAVKPLRDARVVDTAHAAPDLVSADRGLDARTDIHITVVSPIGICEVLINAFANALLIAVDLKALKCQRVFALTMHLVSFNANLS